MSDKALESARRTLAIEADGLAQLADGLTGEFAQAVDLLAAAKGRVIISGMGKSGHIGTKMAASFASTGTPAQFVHPAEASHGDLGMITENDVILALSWSGGTAELANLVNYASRFDIALIAMTSNPASLLARASRVCLTLPKAAEACPNGLAPTTSTLMQLALGDALAVALLEQRNFTPADFRNFHPGGKLGAGLMLIGEVMHQGDALPLISEDTKMSAAIVTMSEKGFGCIGVCDAQGRLAGVITDGDLRRNMSATLLEQAASDIMTRSPKTVDSTLLAGQALSLMNDNKIQAVFVCEDDNPIGLVRIHDLLAIGVA